VLPLLPLTAPVRAAATSINTGPFGETIANTQLPQRQAAQS
jgi:hypothetical protein